MYCPALGRRTQSSSPLLRRMAITCPKCGGSEVHPITPGFYECVTPVQVGWNDAPPAVTKAGFQRTPVFGECGHSFSVAAGSTPPCQIPRCGRDSIGTCQGRCGRRLCGLHGSRTGSLLCADCIAESERERSDHAARVSTERAATQESLRAEVHARLTDCTTHDDLRSALEKYQRHASQDDVRSAWQRLGPASFRAGTHELVTLIGRSNLLGRLINEGAPQPGSWSETGRQPLWRCWTPTPDESTETWDQTSPKRWLDATGQLWKATTNRLTVFRGEEEKQLILAKGASYRLRRGSVPTLPGGFRFAQGALLAERDGSDAPAYAAGVLAAISQQAAASRPAAGTDRGL